MKNDWKIWEEQAIQKEEQKKKNKNIQRWRAEFRVAEDDKNKVWKEVYYRYLKSDIWSELRLSAIKRAGNICEGCRKSNDGLQVHHKTYERIGGLEKLTDLEVLCEVCHQKADKNREDKTIRKASERKYQNSWKAFAEDKYGEDWEYDIPEEDWEKIEIEFITWLYKKHGKDVGFPYDANAYPSKNEDPEDWCYYDYPDFCDFWDDVRNGDF